MLPNRKVQSLGIERKVPQKIYRLAPSLDGRGKGEKASRRKTRILPAGRKVKAHRSNGDIRGP